MIFLKGNNFKKKNSNIFGLNKVIAIFYFGIDINILLYIMFSFFVVILK